LLFAILFIYLSIKVIEVFVSIKVGV